ncbi:FecCD family ABC transporter permease [Rhizobium sp. SL42]|uniref:FecCD family ABC transporter permease n=1 Tax=Rhizobium sp. SL42 TaxID=2806346 RepID=UPI001F016CA8|nr:iron chelate uptake ABC transporter family permease subunit [Rhizobium sp. SL42]UJW77507.1 iron chelate uptake ABC transporter family permease subunit [Rhizobium sp. SL42]
MSFRSHTTLQSRRRLKIIRMAGGMISLRSDTRLLTVSAILFLASLAGIAFSLSTGAYHIRLTDVLATLVGNGDEQMRLVVLEWRLPRVLLAFLLGMALGMSGAIFQSLTRNPLGSPDVIGFATGSYTGGLVVMLFLSGGYYATAAGALTGGLVTALLVYLLTYRQGIQGFRLIVVGIGVAAMLQALNAWMIRRAELDVAMSAALWGAGSLNGLGLEQLWPVLITLLVLLPPLALLVRPMRQLEMGDDMAAASGVQIGATRVFLIVLGVALTGLATAAAGPISFVALCAPQIARRLTRSAGVDLVSSALTGALLLIGADYIAQHAFGFQFPVGVMTVSLGGLYFIWLLIKEARK